MDLQRRAVLAASLAWATQARATAQIWGDKPTPAAGDLGAPAWPPAERVALWPGPPPGMPPVAPDLSLTMNGPRGERELWVSGIATPEINVFRSPHPDGSALLVLPGGAYSFLSVENEGIDVARRFTPFGTSVFVLTYRLPGEGWYKRDRVPLQDAQRAMRMLRSKAAAFAIDPGRLGVLGFSAGGHLACDLSTAFDESCYAPIDAADSLSARPAFAGLIYPVASLELGVGHAVSRDKLLGEGASVELIALRSPARHIRADTPPCFVLHAMDDETVPVDASLRWIAGCRTAHVPIEAHLFQNGGHGFGLHGPLDLPVSLWPDLFGAWMRFQLESHA